MTSEHTTRHSSASTPDVLFIEDVADFALLILFMRDCGWEVDADQDCGHNGNGDRYRVKMRRRWPTSM